MRQGLKTWAMGGLFLLISGTVCSQTIKYTVIENKPYYNKLNIGISPLDFRLIGGNPMGGPEVSVQFRPIDRVKLDASMSSALYFKSFDNDTALSRLQKAGGLFAEGGAEFIWRRTGINLKKNKDDTTPMETMFPLKSSSTYSGNTQITKTKGVAFPFNRVVERGVRGGVMYCTIPYEENASGFTGAYVGITKRIFKAATIDAEGYGKKSRMDMTGYHFDLLFGKAQFLTPPTDGGGSGMGARFGIDVFTVGGLAPVGTTFEFGAMPGVGSFMRVKFFTSILAGKGKYEGDYVLRRKFRKTIPALIQSL